MTKVDDAQEILRALELPPRQQNKMSALTLLALCGIGPDDPWQNAQRQEMTVSLGIMAFMQEKYQQIYAPNTRETVRRQVLHQFIQASIVDYNPETPSRPTNSPKAGYAISELALPVIRSFGTSQWTNQVEQFHTYRRTGQHKRNTLLVSVHTPDGQQFQLSPGKHNMLQAAVIEQFAPRFAPGAQLLYLGDTAKKNLYFNENTLKSLRIPITEHGKLPDIILYDQERNWLFLIEAVTSHGPMSPTRVIQLKEILVHCSAGPVFVTAFSTLAQFRKHLTDIAWETEVWIAETPDHLIHYNGDHFLGPR